MKRQAVVILGVLVSAALLAGGEARSARPDFGPGVASSPVLERFSPEQKKDLLAGEAVYEYELEEQGDGKGEGQAEKTSGGARAFVLIHAPVETCFERFSDIETHTQYFPRKTVSRVLGVREDGRVSVYKELDFKVKTIRYYILYTIDPAEHRIDFQLDDSRESDINSSQGFFHFIAVDPDTTLFDYGLTNTAVSMKVPGFIRRYMTSKDLPRVVTNYKKWIESGGTWTK